MLFDLFVNRDFYTNNYISSKNALILFTKDYCRFLVEQPGRTELSLSSIHPAKTDNKLFEVFLLPNHNRFNPNKSIDLAMEPSTIIIFFRFG